MFIKLTKKDSMKNPVTYIINVKDITYIKEYIDSVYNIVEIYIKGHGAIRFYADDTKPLLDYMQSNNLMINTNT